MPMKIVFPSEFITNSVPDTKVNFWPYMSGIGRFIMLNGDCVYREEHYSIDFSTSLN